MLVFLSELKQLIVRNMSATYISVKASNIHFRVMTIVQTPNLRFDAKEWHFVLVEVRHADQDFLRLCSRVQGNKL